MRPRLLAVLAVAIAGGGLALWLLRGSAGTHEAAAPASPADEPSSAPAVLAGTADAPARVAQTAADEPAAAPRDPKAEKANRRSRARAVDGTIEVLVLSAEDEHPVPYRRFLAFEHPGGKAIEWGMDPVWGTHESAFHTGTDGRTVLRFRPGSYRVVCPLGSAPPAADEGQLVLDLAAGEERKLVFHVSTEARVAFVCRVIDAITEEPIAGATLAFPDESWLRGLIVVPPSLRREWSERASDGRGLLQGSAPAGQRFDASISASGHQSAGVRVGPGNETESTAALVRLRPLARLRALVRGADGRALAGAEAELLLDTSGLVQGFELGDEQVAARSPTDESGLAWLEPPTDRSLVPAVLVEGVRRTGFAPPLTMAAGEERQVVWTLGSCTIAGRVLDPDGKPVEGQVVWAYAALPDEPDVGRLLAGTQPVAVATSDKDGAFALPGIGPGTWDVGLAPQNELSAGLPPERVEILGGEREKRVVLRAPGAGLWIRGRLEDEAGNAAQGVVFAIGPMDANIGTNRKGEFALGPLLPGRYQLLASGTGPSGSTSLPDVAAGTDGLRIVLPSGVAIEGSVIGAEGAAGTAWISPREGFSTSCVRVKADGSFRFEHASPGRYGLAVLLEDGRCGRTVQVEVQAGAPPPPLSIELQPGARLRLRAKTAPEGSLRARVDDCTAWIGNVGSTPVDLVLPAGHCTIETLLGKLVASTTLVAGQSKELVLGER